jgi:PAS domain S-box-containing protein
MELNELLELTGSLNSAASEAEAADIIAGFTFKNFKWDKFALYLYDQSGILTKILEKDNFPDHPGKFNLQEQVSLLQIINTLKNGNNILALPNVQNEILKEVPVNSVVLPLRFREIPLGFITFFSEMHTESDFEKIEKMRCLFSTVFSRFYLEKKILHSEAQYYSIFDNSPTGIFQTDDGGRIISVNNSFVKMLGYESAEEVLALNIEEDVYYDKKIRREILAKYKNGNCSFFDEVQWKRKDGSLIWVQFKLNSCVNSNGEPYYQGYATDITGIMLIRTNIEHSLKEKEALLREVHHRVKNNLQVISSLISLQSEMIEKKDASELFRETQNRIRSMALIHDLQYQSEKFSEIDFKLYIENFVNFLLVSFSITPGDITVRMNLCKVYLPIDTAIPCGLILNEILTNSIKHNRNSSCKLEISIEMCAKNDNISLKIFDNGCSLHNEQLNPGLGLAIIQSLTEQINGKFIFEPDKGAMYYITFNNIK